MPLRIKAGPRPSKQAADKKTENETLKDRVNHNPFEFAQDVAFLEHCARIYGEENFRLTFQALRPYRERLERYMPPAVEETEFDAYDENWWTEQLEGIIEDIQKVKEEDLKLPVKETTAETQQTAQNVKNSSTLQDDTEETEIFMPRQIRRKTDFTMPFSQSPLRIKQLNDGRVAVIGERSREIVKSRILGGI